MSGSDGVLEGHLVCSRGYKQAREGEDHKSLVEGSSIAAVSCVLVSCSSVSSLLFDPR